MYDSLVITCIIKFLFPFTSLIPVGVMCSVYMYVQLTLIENLIELVNLICNNTTVKLELFL